MQEEQGEVAVPAWLCPLCQQGQTDRDSLALHLTDGHSVLPACLDRLLNTAIPVPEGDARQDTDSTQQMHPEILGAQSNPSETAENSSCPLPVRSHEDKVVSQPEHTVREEAEESLKSDHGIEESSNTQKESYKTSKPVDKAIGRNSKLTRNLALEKFLDLARPFKCIVCLESFSSKSSLSVHYSSPAHLHRMRMGSSKQVTENDSNQSRPYIPSKPYKCSVCRVSYNHAITLDSHLKSVLHQTRSRNAGNVTSSTEENFESKSENNSGNEATDDSGNSVAQSVGVATSEGASLSASTVMTKDGDKITSQLALSMHSSPVASAQAVSAFLTLLTSGSPSPSPSPSLTHSLFMGHAGSAHQLLPQQQLLMPLFLNGLQGQSLSPNQESIGPVLAQSVPVMSLGAQQALLAQRLGDLQSAAEIPRKVCWAEDKVSAGETMEGVEKVKAIVQEDDDEEEEDEECSRMKVDAEKVLLKHIVKVEENITERDINKETELNISLSRKGNEIVDDNIDENEEGEKKYEIVIDNMTEQSNCGKQLKLKEHVKEEPEVSCDIVNPNLTKFQSDLNTIPSDHSPLPCSLSPSCRTSLSPMNFNLTLNPVPNPQNSFTDTISRPSLNPIPALDSRLSLGCIKNELSSHVTQTTAINTNPAVDPQDPRRTSAILKPYDSEQCPPILSEFQFQVLWAFLESRCEVDVNSPLREDCEALGREVGLSEEEVRRWLRNARVSKENQKEGGTECVGCEEVQKERLSESAGVDGTLDKEDEKEEGVLTIVEGRMSPVSSGLVMDLSNRGGRARKEEQGRASQGESCLTSDSEAEEFYTSVILTEEDSQSDSMQEELSSPAKETALGDKAEYVTGGGKVLRSSTVFLSDAEYEEAGEDGIAKKAKRIKRKKVTDREQVKVKRMRRNPEVDQPLEAQTDSLASTKRKGLPRISTSGVLHSLPISLSLAPFASQFLSPYVLSLPPSSVGLSIADRGEDQDRVNVPVFSNPPTVTRCPDPFNVPPPSSRTPLPQSLPNGGDCESALDLSIGKSYGSAPAQSSSASTNDRTLAQRDKLLDGLGLRPTSIGVPGTGGLLVVQVKPDSTIGIPAPSRNDFSIHSNKGKISNMPIKAAEQVSTTVREREKDRKNPKVRRYRDMRRSRTVIHSDQLDVLYGCYFKDPNPGKHEFEQISEWIHLPKKVVQIWFQNMRARERKGEVRFISDGTLAAVGKPLIKFTWPLTQPIFSSGSKPNSTSPHSSGVTAKPNPLDTCPKIKPEQELRKQKEAPALSKVAASRSVPNTGISAPSVPKAKIESDAPAALTQTIPKVSAVISTLPAVKTPVKRKRGKEHEIKKEEEENTDDEEKQESNNFGPGTTNRMVPKLPFKHLGKHSVPESQKNNRLNYWSPQGPFKINTLCRDQLGLSTTSPLKDTSTTPSVASKSPPAEGAYLQQSTPRRPRTLLTSLQLSILQSCYETCAHPNALECEAVGTELGLPLKVVQIWFQNTRAKEKRWRLQQEKQSPSSTDSPKKVDVSSGSYLHYSALRANRPILPKPVKLTVVEPSTPPVLGQPAGRETLRGRCEVCAVCFESRAAGRAHVFSVQHLATLRVTNFGQLPSLVNNGSNAWSSSDSGVATSSSPSLTNTSS